jgi:hypothetical protein
MKPYLCTCGNTLYFDNTRCLACQAEVGYDPFLDAMVPVGFGTAHTRCFNGSTHGICNWVVPATQRGTLCLSCNLTKVIPLLSVPDALPLWSVMEENKRHLIYSLKQFGLPIIDKATDPAAGLAFQFKVALPDQPVITEHDKGLIVINLEEADDVVRERNRKNLHEPYRTMLGHFRHEVGHYYWYLWFELGNGFPRELDACRQVFGDDRADYDAAMKIHYQNGAPLGWENSFISSYSSMHPWEDWAETWAQYLHICDGLETARQFGLETGVKGKQIDLFTPAAAKLPAPFDTINTTAFLDLIHRWVRLSPALNAFSQSLGHQNLYPFVLSVPVVQKLHFIHHCITTLQMQRPGTRA